MVQGAIGFISPLSEHFCAACNRLRLTADGRLRPCLFSDWAVDVKPALDTGAGAREVQTLIQQAIGLKPRERPLLTTASVAEQTMSLLGG